MAYEEKLTVVHKPHNVIMEERARLSISGVEDVESFDESEIVMTTTKGSLIIKGSELHIEKLSLETGELSVEGFIDDLSYEDRSPSGGFWSRLFK